MNHKKKFQNLTLIVLMFSILATGSIFLAPKKTYALSFYSLFGGKVESYGDAIECNAVLDAVKVVIDVFTGGAVDYTLEMSKMKVGKPREASIGVIKKLEIEHVPIIDETKNIDINKALQDAGIDVNKYLPFFPKYYSYKNHKTNDVWVIGKSINICGVKCDSKSKNPLEKWLCDTGLLSNQVIKTACDQLLKDKFAGCPINNILNSVGSGNKAVR